MNTALSRPRVGHGHQTHGGCGQKAVGVRFVHGRFSSVRMALQRERFERKSAEAFIDQALAPNSDESGRLPRLHRACPSAALDERVVNGGQYSTSDTKLKRGNKMWRRHRACAPVGSIEASSPPPATSRAPRIAQERVIKTDTVARATTSPTANPAPTLTSGVPWTTIMTPTATTNPAIQAMARLSVRARATKT